MGIELSPGRRKKLAARRKSRAWAGPVVTRQAGDPVPDEAPPTPIDKYARRVGPLPGPGKYLGR